MLAQYWVPTSHALFYLCHCFPRSFCLGHSVLAHRGTLIVGLIRSNQDVTPANKTSPNPLFPLSHRYAYHTVSPLSLLLLLLFIAIGLVTSDLCEVQGCVMGLSISMSAPWHLGGIQYMFIG